MKNDRKNGEKDEKEIERLIKKLPIPQILIKDMVLENPSESLVIIGNGFEFLTDGDSFPIGIFRKL